LLNCDCESNLELDLVGLLGKPDGDKTNDWITPDGDSLELPSEQYDYYLEPAFEFSKLWVIKDEETSLFSYEDGKTFDDFYIPDEEYDEDIEVIFEEEPSEEIRDLCGDNVECRLDAEALGPDAGEETLDHEGNHADDEQTGDEQTGEEEEEEEDGYDYEYYNYDLTDEPEPEVCVELDPYGENCDNKGVTIIGVSAESDSAPTTKVPIEDIFFNIVVGTTDDGVEPAVSFDVQNPFPGTTDMYVQYMDAETHNSECLGATSVNECGKMDIGEGERFDAVCTPGHDGAFTVVTVWFVDKDETTVLFEDSTTVKECCQPTDVEGKSVVRYTLAIACECKETYRKLRVAKF